MLSDIGRIGEFFFARYVRNGFIYFETFTTIEKARKALSRIKRRRALLNSA